MDAAASVPDQISSLGLPEEARAWLVDIWQALVVLNASAEGTQAGRSLVEDVTAALFVRMPLNPFWQQSFSSLVPVLALQIIKASAARAAETSGQADERSFVWRAGYFDLAASACLLCGLPAAARDALSLYGESFSQYREVFPCQPLQ